MGVDEGNLLIILLLIVMGVERYILTSSSYGVEMFRQEIMFPPSRSPR